MFLLLACSTCSLDDTALTDGSPRDSAAVGAIELFDLSAAAADIPTVIRVSWTTAEPCTSVVTGTAEGAVVETTETEATTSHSVLLAGLPPLSEVAVSVTVARDDDVGSGQTLAETGGLPGWLPRYTYSAHVPKSAAPGFVLAPAILANGGGIVAFDGLGRVVWAWPQGSSANPDTLFRARLSMDGQYVLANEQAYSAETEGSILRIALDGSTVDRVKVLSGHTDFAEYAPGGYLVLGWEIREMDNRKILADSVIEVAPDGAQRELFNAFDAFTLDLSREYDHFYLADPAVEDWTHINGISYAAEDDTFYLTATFNNGVLHVDRPTGSLLWTLSDSGGDFENLGDSEMMMFPHSAEAVEGGVLVFNRNNFVDGTGCSEAVELELDAAAGTARQVWSYASERCVLTSSLGAAQRLPGGNTLVTFTAASQADETTSEGDLAWRVSAPAGSSIGFTSHVPRLGP
jgi:hypothetical protein